MLDPASQFCWLFCCKGLLKILTSRSHAISGNKFYPVRHLRCMALVSSAISLSINQMCWIRSVPTTVATAQSYDKVSLRCSCCSTDYVENLVSRMNLSKIEAIRALVASNSKINVIKSKLEIRSKRIDLQTFTVASICGTPETLSLFRNKRYGTTREYIEYAQHYASCVNTKNWFRLRLL